MVRWRRGGSGAVLRGDVSGFAGHGGSQGSGRLSVRETGTPLALAEGWTDPDPAVAKRVFDAMMPMKKIDIAAIEAARRG